MILSCLRAKITIFESLNLKQDELLAEVVVHIHSNETFSRHRAAYHRIV